MVIDGAEILAYREEHGISLKEMAELLNIEEDQLYNYEQGVEEWIEEDALNVMLLDSMFNNLDFIQVEDIDLAY